jgi:hypothetical protein
MRDAKGTSWIGSPHWRNNKKNAKILTTEFCTSRRNNSNDDDSDGECGRRRGDNSSLVPPIVDQI